MYKYFAGDFPDGPFELFSTSHVMALLIIIIINSLIFIFRDRIRKESISKYFCYTIASLLILQEISYNIWHASIGDWSVASTLPLHLCGISVVLSAVMLIKKSYNLYEIIYFWGVGGATQALLTPDIGIYAFPHYRFFQFFISHGLIVTACLFATFVLGYRPKLKSIWKAVAALNVYMILIAVFNGVTGGNYLFICRKPDTASLMDYLGPWPWYIISLEVLGVIIFFIVYTPFIVSGLLKKSRMSNNYLDV
jgi:hypothetical integral membrane protein (TIGR02206 family)